MKTKYLTKAIRCPDGSRKYIRGKTQKELDQKVAKARAELGMGLNINDGTIVLELAQTWVDVYVRPHVKPQSLGFTLRLLNNYIIPIIGGMRVRDVKPADCARVMAEAAPLSNGCQRRVLSMLRTLFKLAVENRIIVYSPVSSNLRASGARAKEPTPLTRGQLDRLLAAAGQCRKPWVYTFILLASHTGLRLSEALGLNWDCVDFENALIHVRRQLVNGSRKPVEILKTSGSARTIPMPPVLSAHLDRLRRLSAGVRVLDTGLNDPHHAIRRYMSQLAEQAGLDVNVHPHLLRHTYATFCFEAGLDVKEVQYLLGHSTAQMTMNVYVHYMQSARREDTAAKLAKAFSAPPLAAIG